MYRTLEEAINARLDLVERIQGIEAQLAERAAKVAAVRVPDKQYQDYMQWKARACRAKANMITRLARTKIEIQKLRRAESEARISARGGDTVLLDNLYDLTKSLVSAGADISTDEQRLLDDVAAYLQNRG
jgi:hypothetical protein